MSDVIDKRPLIFFLKRYKSVASRLDPCCMCGGYMCVCVDDEQVYMGAFFFVW